MNRQVWIVTVSLLGIACATPASFPTRRSPALRSELTPQETDVILTDAAGWMKSDRSRGDLRALRFDSIQADPPLLMIFGCGTFGGTVFRERRAVTIIAVRDGAGWRMHSWQVDTDGLHGPPMSCR